MPVECLYINMNGAEKHLIISKAESAVVEIFSGESFFTGAKWEDTWLQMRRQAWTLLIYWCLCQQAAWQGEWSRRDFVQMEKMSSSSLEDIWQFLISNSTPSSSRSNFIFPSFMLPGIYGGSGVAIMIRISFVQRYLLEEYVLLFNFAEQLELRFLLWNLAHLCHQPPAQSVFNRSYD